MAIYRNFAKGLIRQIALNGLRSDHFSKRIPVLSHALNMLISAENGTSLWENVRICHQKSTFKDIHKLFIIAHTSQTKDEIKIFVS